MSSRAAAFRWKGTSSTVDRSGLSPSVSISPSVTPLFIGRTEGSSMAKNVAHTLRVTTSVFPPVSLRLGYLAILRNPWYA